MPKTPHNSHKAGKEPKHGKCPPLEEAVNFYIENDADRDRALDFAAWLRKNKLSPSAGNNGYNWYVKFSYINQNVLKDGKYHRSTYHGVYIKLFDDTWQILPSKDILERVLLHSDLKEIAEQSVFPCYGCSYGCFKKIDDAERTRTLFGRKIPIKAACLRQPICLTNPDETTLAALKEILLTRRSGEDLMIGENMTIYNYGIL